MAKSSMKQTIMFTLQPLTHSFHFYHACEKGKKSISIWHGKENRDCVIVYILAAAMEAFRRGRFDFMFALSQKWPNRWHLVDKLFPFCVKQIGANSIWNPINYSLRFDEKQTIFNLIPPFQTSINHDTVSEGCRTRSISSMAISIR